MTFTPEVKREWGPGPWVDEPDRVCWVDDATGYTCLLRRHPCGFWAGDVGVPIGHPWHGRALRASGLLRVHGGLVFAGHLTGEDPDDMWWFGFDCGHNICGDLAPGQARIMEAVGVPAPEDLDSGLEYRTVEFAQAQCVALAAQLAALSAE